jgi:DNA-binding GntR family transcriptional regulator
MAQLTAVSRLPHAARQLEIGGYFNVNRPKRGALVRNWARLAAGHDEHPRIVEALRACDPEAAEATPSRHVGLALEAELTEYRSEPEEVA